MWEATAEIKLKITGGISQNGGSRNSRKERFRNTVYEKLVTKYRWQIRGERGR